METMNEASVDQVLISSINDDGRARIKMGGLTALALDIEKHGLYHPIILTNAGVLISGARRLQAFKKLKRKRIPARRVGDLTSEELRQIELNENVLRLDLTSEERSRIVAAKAETEEDPSIRKNSESKQRGGGVRSKGNSAAAKALNVDEGTVRNAKKHVSALDTVPFLSGLPASRVTAAAEQLASIAKPAQKAVVDLCEELVADGMPKKALRVIEKVSGYSEEVQKETARMVTSKDPDEQMRGKVRMVAVPPSPPVGLTKLGEIIRKLKHLLEDEYITPKSSLRSAIKSVEDVIDGTDAKYQKYKESERVRLGLEVW